MARHQLLPHPSNSLTPRHSISPPFVTKIDQQKKKKKRGGGGAGGGKTIKAGHFFLGGDKTVVVISSLIRGAQGVGAGAGRWGASDPSGVGAGRSIDLHFA